MLLRNQLVLPDADAALARPVPVAPVSYARVFVVKDPHATWTWAAVEQRERE